MEKYDSSIETLKHIKQVALYIDKVQQDFATSLDLNYQIHDNINYVTLVDLYLLLIKGENIPSYSKLFTDINNNSRKYKYGNSNYNHDELFHIYQEELSDRKLNHDKSKLEEPEKHDFDIWTPRINEATLGTPMYEYFLKELHKALDHHYRYNRHHPEHFGNGINGMTIMDLTEMLCDWCATSDRHKNSNIYDSIDILQKRFRYSTPMKKVLSNTVEKHFTSLKSK